MGGRSSSRVEQADEGGLQFSGHVSLENNGGFASARAAVGPLDLSAFDGLALRVRGGGRRYQLRLRHSPDQRIWYRASFDTEPDAWTELRVSFDAFEPTFRGRRPPDAEPLDSAAIGQIGILIADEREGPFALDVEWIRPYGE